MRATTDSGSAVNRESLSAGVTNLLVLYQVLAGTAWEEALHRFDGQPYSHLKREVADVVVSCLEKIQGEYRRLTEDPRYLDAILSEGRERAEAVAIDTLTCAKAGLGL